MSRLVEETSGGSLKRTVCRKGGPVSRFFEQEETPATLVQSRNTFGAPRSLWQWLPTGLDRAEGREEGGMLGPDATLATHAVTDFSQTR